MARGFWTGVVHGGLLCVASLAVLSLLAPGPQGTVPGGPAVAPGAGSSEDVAAADSPTAPQVATADPAVTPPTAATPQDSVPGATETGETEQATDRPRGLEVDLPVGSEFGRGGDIAPLRPAPLAVIDDRMGQSEAPAVSAPAAEPSPVALTAPTERPRAEAPGEDLRLSAPEQSDAAPQFDRPGTLSSPDRPQAPQMAGLGAPDRLPATPPAEAVLATPSEAAPDRDEKADGAPARPAAPGVTRPAPVATPQPAIAPRLPSPSLDLSTPPDLSDLRGLAGN